MLIDYLIKKKFTKKLKEERKKKQKPLLEV
jgi:hypothetical protein